VRLGARLIALAAALLFAAACTSTHPRSQDETPASGPSEVTSPAPKATSDRFLEACTKRCEHARSMRAIGWQMIQAECRRECEAEWGLPLITGAAELARFAGDRIRTRGRWKVAGEKVLLVLEDGSALEIRPQNQPSSDMFGVVIATGTLVLEGGAPKLDLHTAVSDESP
jgi:hypothetical protein